MHSMLQKLKTFTVRILSSWRPDNSLLQERLYYAEGRHHPRHPRHGTLKGLDVCTNS